jgi:hypothetical protein
LQAPLQGKYGGISPKKALINKDHERAYFDSADWVLGKVAKYSSTQLVAAQRLRVSNRGRYNHMSELTPSPGGCLQQQGVSSNSTKTVSAAAEPLKPKLQVYGERVRE